MPSTVVRVLSSLSLVLAAVSSVSAQDTCTPADITNASIINTANANLEWGVTSPTPSSAIVSSSFRGQSAQDWQIVLNGDFAPVFIIREISNQDLVISSPNGEDLELQSSEGLEAGGTAAQTWRIRCNTCSTGAVVGEGCVFQALGPDQNRCAEIGSSSDAQVRIADCDGSDRQSFTISA